MPLLHRQAAAGEGRHETFSLGRRWLLKAAADLARTAKAAARADATQESTRCAEWSLEVLRQARHAGLKNIPTQLDGPHWEPVRRLPGFAELVK